MLIKRNIAGSIVDYAVVTDGVAHTYLSQAVLWMAVKHQDKRAIQVLATNESTQK